MDLQSRPGKRGLPESISPSMQPMDQISIAFVYCLNLLGRMSDVLTRMMGYTHVNMISGARYQRVATYSVMNPEGPPSLPIDSAVCVDLANPKSQTYHSPVSKFDEGEMEGGRTLRSQLALRRRLEGLRSR